MAMLNNQRVYIYMQKHVFVCYIGEKRTGILETILLWEYHGIYGMFWPFNNYKQLS
jgi:hypothetical protein